MQVYCNGVGVLCRPKCLTLVVSVEMAFLIVNLHGQSPGRDLSALETGDFNGMSHTRASLQTPDRPPKNHLKGFELTLKEQEVIRRKSQAEANSHPVAFNNVGHPVMAELNQQSHSNGGTLPNGLGPHVSAQSEQRSRSNPRLLDRLKLPRNNSIGAVESTTATHLYNSSGDKF